VTFDAIQPGLKGQVRQVVTEENTARHLGSGGVSVLATPYMVLLMEMAGVAAVDFLLPEGYCTVGAHIDVSHLAPTPVGYEIRVTAELIEVDGKRLSFRVKAYEGPFDPDGGGGQLVGEGVHQRAIINVQRFGERVAQKLAEAHSRT
jgi:predicted thioesterase